MVRLRYAHQERTHHERSYTVTPMRHLTPLLLLITTLTACDGAGLDTLTDNTIKADPSDPAQAQALDSNTPAQPATPAAEVPPPSPTAPEPAL